MVMVVAQQVNGHGPYFVPVTPGTYGVQITVVSTEGSCQNKNLSWDNVTVSQSGDTQLTTARGTPMAYSCPS